MRSKQYGRNCDEFGFWVFSPAENDQYLWKNGVTEKQFREVLTEKGNKSFKKIYLETILEKLSEIVTNQSDRNWLNSIERKYKIS